MIGWGWNSCTILSTVRAIRVAATRLLAVVDVLATSSVLGKAMPFGRSPELEKADGLIPCNEFTPYSFSPPYNDNEVPVFPTP